MPLSDLFFGTDFFNRLGRRNIRGDELATMIALGGVVGGGALVSREASQSIDADAVTPVIFDSETYDDAGFFDLGGAPTRLTVPAGITRIQLWCTLRWTEDAAIELITVSLKNGDDFSSENAGPGMFADFRNPQDDDFGYYITLSSASVVVVEGDFFELGVEHTNATDPQDLLKAQFGILALR